MAAASGRGVFDGNVKVNRLAQKTDAQQLSRNLLLVPRAMVNVKPNLQARPGAARRALLLPCGRLCPSCRRAHVRAGTADGQRSAGCSRRPPCRQRSWLAARLAPRIIAADAQPSLHPPAPPSITLLAPAVASAPRIIAAAAQRCF